MLKVGYWLASELHGPGKLVDDARKAEELGFEYALISDHYLPWLHEQGHSPFVWNVIGGIARATQRLRLGTAVTCPIIRTHPAIIAHAAATSAAMMPGRFMLGLGTGENLNEHILGDKWPAAKDRLDMLEEAVEIIRHLWTGKLVSHRGRRFTVENARIYDLPPELPPILIAASGPHAAAVAACMGDGLITASLEPDIVSNFDQAGISGQAKRDLALPAHFREVAAFVSEDYVSELIVCGPDPAPHIEKFRSFVEAGYTHVCVHQVTPDQEGFFRFYEREVLPQLSRNGLMEEVGRAVAAPVAE